MSTKLFIFGVISLISPLLSLASDSKSTAPATKTVNLSVDEVILDPNLQGMDLSFSLQKKIINVELPSKDFLELSFNLPYFTPPKDAYVSLKDVRTIYEIHAALASLTQLPLQEQVQPATQAKIKANLEALRVLGTNQEKRIYVFSLTDAEREQLKQTAKK